jgi:hypothetical protein
MYLFPKTSRLDMRPTEPPIRLVLEFIPRGTAAGHEGDHVPPSSAEVTNEWSCAFMVWTGTA